MQKTIPMYLLAMLALTGCGGGGGDSHAEDTHPPVEETTPPPAIEGGDIPDLGVDFIPPVLGDGELPNMEVDPPATEGGEQPEMEVRPPILPLYGPLVETKKADDGTYFLKIKKHNQPEPVWVLSTTHRNETFLGGTTFFRGEGGIEDAAKFKVTVNVSGKEALSDVCKYIPEDGEEFCAPHLYQGQITPYYAASSSWTTHWDKEKGIVRLNEVDFKVSEFHNFGTLNLLETSVVIVKQETGDLIAIAQSDPKAPYERNRLYTKVSKADFADRSYEYTGYDGNPVKMRVYTNASEEYLTELESVEVGDVVLMEGGGSWGYYGPDFFVDDIYNLKNHK